MSQPQRRFPGEALLATLRPESMTELARTCSLDRRQMQRYIRDGVPEAAADRIAVRVGLHPCEVWPEWFGGAA